MSVEGLVLAVRYLTIVPLPGGPPHQGGSALGRAASWFPVVGLGIGGVLVVTERVTAALFPTVLSALLTVTAWKLLTGGLHLDGLADSLDALVVVGVEQRLDVMRDSRIGAFGAIGLVLFLALEVAALAELGAVRWRALLVAPAVARAGPAVLARRFAPARPTGQGAQFFAGVPARAMPVGVGIAVLAGGTLLGWAGLLAVVVALLAALGLASFLARRFGGITGDVLGAAVEVAELGVLLTVSAWTHAGR